MLSIRPRDILVVREEVLGKSMRCLLLGLAYEELNFYKDYIGVIGLVIA